MGSGTSLGIEGTFWDVKEREQGTSESDNDGDNHGHETRSIADYDNDDHHVGAQN